MKNNKRSVGVGGLSQMMENPLMDFIEAEQRMDIVTTTPAKLGGFVQDFARSLPEAGGDAQYVPVKKFAGAKMNECFANVEAYIQQHGGKAINGWLIWFWPGVFMSAEFHACWKSSTGELVDVSPRRETNIAFVPAPTLAFTGERRANIFKPIKHAKEVLDYIEAVTKFKTLMQPGENAVTNELIQASVEVQAATVNIMRWSLR